MNVPGVVMAIILLAGIVAGVSYGTYAGYEFLSVQWGILSNDWRAILIVVATMLAGCTLFISLNLQSAMKRYGLNGSGKVIAYNDFLNWYSELKNNPDQILTAESFRQTANQMKLWGSHQVSKHAGLLYDLLQKNDQARDQVLEKSGLLHIEIRRDLGLRGTSGENTIV